MNQARSYLLISVLLFCCVGVFSQDYKPDFINHQYMYEHGGSECYFYKCTTGISIDSFSVNALDSTFYTYRVVDDSIYLNGCMKPFDTLWTGIQITTNGTGDLIFINDQSDSIKIKTRAGIGDTWKLFNFQNGDYINAEVISIKPQQILGVQDSIKTIELQAKNGLNANISHIFNGKNLRFSQSNGFVTLFNFRSFPLDTITYSLIGVSNPDRGAINIDAAAIFDYQIGDEFHYHDMQNLFPAAKIAHDDKGILKVLNRIKTPTEYTYTMERCELASHWDVVAEEWIYEHILDTIQTVIKLSTYNYLDAMPFQLMDISGFYGYTSLYPKNNRTYKSLGSNLLLDSAKTCLTYLMGHGANPTIQYGDGLGLTYYQNEGFQSIGTEYELIYYKKGNDTWGTPLNCSDLYYGISKINKSNYFLVYPTLFSETLFLNIDQRSQQSSQYISIYNIQGNAIVIEQEYKGRNKQIRFETSGWPPGLYTVHIRSDRNINVQKVIKVR